MTIINATDPNIQQADRPRVATQNARILAMLRARDRVSNAELADISLKYTSRISDLRKAGYCIRCVRGQGGVAWYTLRQAD